MADEAVPPWAANNHFLLIMPFAKFAMGCAAYLTSVIFISFDTLYGFPLSRNLAVFIGLSSVSTVVMTIGYIYVMKTR